MPEVRSISIDEAEARFPALATAVASITPYLAIFTDGDIAVQPNGTTFEVTSALPFPKLPVAPQRWSATLSADTVCVRCYEQRGWAWVSTSSESFTLDAFAGVLRQISDGLPRLTRGEPRRS